ncbi:MAG: M28 family peptidase [Caldilineaceae bacterium]|nr:M28 family peptidase [Caldilineaceae bacterium]MCB0140624.1 M28 family peptidase [Caldilineaceae bacterium]
MRRLRTYRVELTLVSVLFAAVAFFAYLGYGLVQADSAQQTYSGERAFDTVKMQLDFGPRVTGSPESERYREWLTNELTAKGWNVMLQSFLASDESVQAQNIIATPVTEPQEGALILLGTHFDSRIFADRDPDIAKREQAVPGANGGASSVAVLLELARTLKIQELNYRICLAFFDAGDNGGINGWTSAEGSTYFVAHMADDIPLCSNPNAVIILDAVGSSATLTYEQSSSENLAQALRDTAADLGYANWLDSRPGPVAAADHIPFLRAGFPAIFILDAKYPYRHMSTDTLDKINAEDLQRTGNTLKRWLEEVVQAQPAQ